MNDFVQKAHFVPALAAGRVLMKYYKLRGLERSDHAGMASVRICDDFLTYVRKPPLTVAVSGTNGKTTISCMLTDILRLHGKTVSYNDWGANHHAGHARCFLDSVNVFNRSTKDAAVIEMDELISPVNMPKIKPQYFVISTVGLDSMMRNAHPEYIREKLELAAELCPDTFVVVNADNPLCKNIGKNNRRVFYGVNDLNADPKPSQTNDFPVCDICGSKVEYRYRNYRLLGDYRCSECGMKRPECDYFVESVDHENSTMTVREPSGVYTYPVNSLFLHNIYNYAAVITTCREMGIESGMLAAYLKNIYPPKSRETSETAGGKTVKTILCKGQNVSATSTVFEAVSREKGDKCLVLLLDEYFDDPRESETIAWIFDADYEYLNSPDIKKIVVAGRRYLDHRVRLLMAGIDEDKFVCTEDYREAAQHVPTEGIDAVYVLHDVNFVTKGQYVRDRIAERLNKAGGGI